jgi:hypothetical protein
MNGTLYVDYWTTDVVSRSSVGCWRSLVAYECVVLCKHVNVSYNIIFKTCALIDSNLNYQTKCKKQSTNLQIENKEVSDLNVKLATEGKYGGVNVTWHSIWENRKGVSSDFCAIGLLYNKYLPV